MAVLNKGVDFSDGDQVTSANLDNLVDNAAFVPGASGTTDDSSLEVNGSGRLQVKSSGISAGKIAADSVTTAKLPDSTSDTDGVTLAKMQYLANLRVIGNVSGDPAAPSEVSILDEDAMGSDSDTAIATQQSIKAYVDTYATKYSGTQVFSGSLPTSYTDLDLSGTVGSNRALLFMKVTPDDNSVEGAFRVNGETADYGFTGGVPVTTSAFATGAGGAGNISYVTIMTDSSGVVEWVSNKAGNGASTVDLLTYQVVQ